MWLGLCVIVLAAALSAANSVQCPRFCICTAALWKCNDHRVTTWPLDNQPKDIVSGVRILDMSNSGIYVLPNWRPTLNFPDLQVIVLSGTTFDGHRCRELECIEQLGVRAISRCGADLRKGCSHAPCCHWMDLPPIFPPWISATTPSETHTVPLHWSSTQAAVDVSTHDTTDGKDDYSSTVQSTVSESLPVKAMSVTTSPERVDFYDSSAITDPQPLDPDLVTAELSFVTTYYPTAISALSSLYTEPSVSIEYADNHPVVTSSLNVSEHLIKDTQSEIVNDKSQIEKTEKVYIMEREEKFSFRIESVSKNVSANSSVINFIKNTSSQLIPNYPRPSHFNETGEAIAVSTSSEYSAVYPEKASENAAINFTVSIAFDGDSNKSLESTSVDLDYTSFFESSNLSGLVSWSQENSSQLVMDFADFIINDTAYISVDFAENSLFNFSSSSDVVNNKNATFIHVHDDNSTVGRNTNNETVHVCPPCPSCFTGQPTPPPLEFGVGGVVGVTVAIIGCVLIGAFLLFRKREKIRSFFHRTAEPSAPVEEDAPHNLNNENYVGPGEQPEENGAASGSESVSNGNIGDDELFLSAVDLEDEERQQRGSVMESFAHNLDPRTMRLSNVWSQSANTPEFHRGMAAYSASVIYDTLARENEGAAASGIRLWRSCERFRHEEN
ncbi:uncharacterized protein LOC129602279 isoform X2 [Paramacrobiotus metropolitanus]|uniref:uncharacterized protein LOC129602279 isoform X2 n=1 Tax=Paramacrobiotus metropolitanus TaxID=2943436 RepID=UPI00244611E3|nr:uncharacterized protein LOC129602279 isoform X2 [Paramacrobiotus metropolitanus]